MNQLKYLYALLLVIGSVVTGLCQPPQPLTVGQAYNFAVGDTFEYHTVTDYLPGNNCLNMRESYYIDIITSRQQSGDTILYQAKQFFWSQQSCPTTNYAPPYTDSSIEIITVTQLDSSVFWSLSYHSLGCDSISGYCTDDSVYTDASINNLKFSAFSEDNDSLEASYDSIWGEGIGMYLWNYSYSYETFDNEYAASDFIDLIYYHKTDGSSWGQPYHFTWVTGLNDVAYKSLTAEIFPNPAEEDMVLRLSGPLINTLHLKLFDATGRTVKQLDVTNPVTNVERLDLTAGIYFWQLLDSGLPLSTGKLVIK